MDHLIEETPASEENFIDLDNLVHHPVQFPANSLWVEILNEVKEDFEISRANAALSTWRVAPHDIGNIATVADVHAIPPPPGCSYDRPESHRDTCRPSRWRVPVMNQVPV